jgi:hypothetical protein
VNVIVVLEDQATKHHQESSPYAFAGALEVRCRCGNLIHPIPGAWCTLCGLKVVEVRQEYDSGEPFDENRPDGWSQKATE